MLRPIFCSTNPSRLYKINPNIRIRHFVGEIDHVVNVIYKLLVLLPLTLLPVDNEIDFPDEMAEEEEE